VRCRLPFIACDTHIVRQNFRTYGALMKMLLSAVVAVALLAGVAIPANAQGAPGYYTKKHRAFRPAPQPRAHRPQTETPFYEHLADKLPIGSSRWFEQMQREGRFGNRGG
jgi:hypothetical protein